MRVGSTCFAASIAGPSWLADGVDSVALMALHLATAVVIVLGLAGTVPLRHRLRDHPAAGPEASARTR